MRRGPQPDGVHLLVVLVLDPRLDDVLGEDVALEQELVVVLAAHSSASSSEPGIVGTSFSSSGDSA